MHLADIATFIDTAWRAAGTEFHLTAINTTKSGTKHSSYSVKDQHTHICSITLCYAVENAIKIPGKVCIKKLWRYNFVRDYGCYCYCRSMGNFFKCCVCHMVLWRCFSITKRHAMQLPVTLLPTVHDEHALHSHRVLRELCHWQPKLSLRRLLRGWLKGSSQVDGCRCLLLQTAHRCHFTVSRSLQLTATLLSTFCETFRNYVMPMFIKIW